MKTISLETYNSLVAKLAVFNQWLNGRTSYRAEEVPAHVPQVSNEERSAIEIYEFVNTPPNRYFAYVRRVAGTRQAQITNWMGEVLGNATLGQGYESPAFGGRPSKRIPILKFKAINGKSYFGTFFESSGDYCRLKIAVDKP